MLNAQDWQKIIDFIDERDPGFRGRIRGATAERIAQLQAIHVAKLPRAYVDFLALMGEDHGGFEFSWEHYSTIDELLANGTPTGDSQLPYPETRFLWIAGQKNEEDDSYWGDLYLDMKDGDRDDPPVIAHDFYDEDPDEPGPESILALRFTDLIQSNAYANYERIKNMYQYWFSLQFSKKKTATVWLQLRELLQTMEWRECLPGSDSTWFGQHAEPLSLDVKMNHRGMIRILVGANDRKRVLSVVEELEDEFPTMANPGNWFVDRDEE